MTTRLVLVVGLAAVAGSALAQTTESITRQLIFTLSAELAVSRQASRYSDLVRQRLREHSDHPDGTAAPMFRDSSRSREVDRADEVFVSLQR